MVRLVKTLCIIGIAALLFLFVNLTGKDQRKQEQVIRKKAEKKSNTEMVTEDSIDDINVKLILGF